MNAVQAYLDRRAFGRRPTQIAASVRIGYRLQPCTIKDLSEGGALLEFPEVVELPARLWLAWSDMPNEVVCEVRHVRGRNAGVQFARPISLAIRPTSAPAEGSTSQPLPAPLPRARTSDARNGLSASELVAQRRNALRARGSEADTAAHQSSVRALEPKITTADLPHVQVNASVEAGTAQIHGDTAVPRDVSSIILSMHAELARQAEAIIAARTLSRVPWPLAARGYAMRPGGVADQLESTTVPMPLAAYLYVPVLSAVPGEATTARVPGPLAARRYADGLAVAPVTPDASAARLPATMTVPGPLAAARYRAIGFVDVATLRPPVPLAARAYAV